jgi:hypothetical protein
LTFLAALLSSGSGNSTLNDVEPGALGFLVVAGIGIALVFLLRSMNKQFRKIGPPPEDDVATGTAGPQGPASDSAPSGSEAAMIGDTGAGFDPDSQTGAGFDIRTIDARTIDAKAAEARDNGRRSSS